MRRYKENSVSTPKRILSCILIIAIVAGGFVFAVNQLEDAEVHFIKSFYPVKYSEYVNNACESYDLQPELVYAVIKTESGFDEDAQSSIGAMGLMQLMPETFQWIQGLKGESDQSHNLLSPMTNIDYGCYYLSYLLDIFQEESTAVAAYNAGQSVVAQWLDNSNYSVDGKTLQLIPYKETSDYVQKVENTKEMYRKLYFS